MLCAVMKTYNQFILEKKKRRKRKKKTKSKRSSFQQFPASTGRGYGYGYGYGPGYYATTDAGMSDAAAGGDATGGNVSHEFASTTLESSPDLDIRSHKLSNI